MHVSARTETFAVVWYMHSEAQESPGSIVMTAMAEGRVSSFAGWLAVNSAACRLPSTHSAMQLVLHQLLLVWLLLCRVLSLNAPSPALHAHCQLLVSNRCCLAAS